MEKKEILDPRKGKLIFLARPGIDMTIEEMADAVVEAIFADSKDPNIFIPKDDGEMVEEPGAMVQKRQAKAQSQEQTEGQQTKEE